jgi:hypothetical protein
LKGLLGEPITKQESSEPHRQNKELMIFQKWWWRKGQEHKSQNIAISKFFFSSFY